MSKAICTPKMTSVVVPYSARDFSKPSDMLKAAPKMAGSDSAPMTMRTMPKTLSGRGSFFFDGWASDWSCRAVSVTVLLRSFGRCALFAWFVARRFECSSSETRKK